MKKTAIIFILFFACQILHGQMPALQQKAVVLKRMIELKHYSPRPVDDSFSIAVFKKLLNKTDGRRIYFLESEFKQLSSFQLSIDDELKGDSWAFYDLLGTLYKKALLRADSIADKLLQKPFDFSVNESTTTLKENEFNFAADVTALKDRWARRMKFRAMQRIYDEVSEDSAKKLTFKEALAAKETTTREKLKLTERKTIKKILDAPGGYDAFLSELYLNAIAECFDPHSNYFSAETSIGFQADLSTEELSFGIELDENENGQIVISHLVPGGPGWKSGELHEGDKLETLQWEGKEANDMTSASLEDAYEILDQSSADRMMFRFKKTDGTAAIVLLKKEKLENEENIVRGFVLNGDKKIGYILLPGFYTEWFNEAGSGCANDVAKVIIRLKKENIEGLILDVRYNGGGSIGEALEMAGIFIEEGPLASEKMKDGKQITLKDPNRGTIYDGPLALMVNGQSASASELLAAALQDYNRAVIIGSKTYGKATGQVLFSLDTLSEKAKSVSNKDAAKITIGKIYRLTGLPAQFVGVTPDIILPDIFDALEYREEFKKHALLPDTAKKNNYYKPLPYLPVSELFKKSAARVMASPEFNEIAKFIDDIKKRNTVTVKTIPLKWDAFEKWVKENDPEEPGLKEEEETIAPFKVENHAGDKELLINNSFAKEMNNLRLEDIAADFYIAEAFAVLLDLINLQKAATKN